MTGEYFLSDHLGSTSLTTDTNGNKVSEIRYKPWGEIRYSWTSQPATTPSYKLSSYTFTGQFSYMDDPTTAGTTEGFGLMFYNARWYDPVIGRFTSADTIVPGGVQGLDRYAYVNNSPMNFTDPTGHKCVGEKDECEEDDGTPINGAGGFSGGNSVNSLPDLPSLDDFSNPEGIKLGVRQDTWNAYLSIRNVLWKRCGVTCVDPITGMIKDKYLVALIILGEFGAYKDANDDAYGESLEAASNEYFSAADLEYYSSVGGMTCNGACTIDTQMSWLYDIEAVRSNDFLRLVSEGRYETYLGDAGLATAHGGYTYGGVDSSWHWGNIMNSQKNDFCITAEASPSLYGGTDLYIVYSCKR